MRPRAPLAMPRPLHASFSSTEDDTTRRARAALSSALEELVLPDDNLEDTVKIVRLIDGV